MISTPTGSSGSEPVPVRRLRLHYRIVLPLVVIALVSASAAAWVAVEATSRALQGRLQAQLENSAIAVSQGTLALNPVILRTLRDIVGAEIVTVGPDGAVLATSLLPDRQALVAVARDAVKNAPVTDGGPPKLAAGDCGFPCLIVVREVGGHPGTRVALVAETSPLTTATGAVARAILWSALASVVVLVLASQAVLRRFTVPLDRLVRFVRELSAGARGERAQVSNDEVGVLAEAFNGMLDRLDRSQAALVQSEKLGLAGLMAARVAHDIRNPLSSIKMQAQLLKGKLAGDPEDRETLDAVLRDINQVESVVRDLMELAKPGDLRLAPAPINEVIEDALRQLAPQFAHRKIAVERHLADRLPLVAVDRPRLKQALLNVLVNGSEAMHTGGQMTVSTNLSDDQTSVWIRICDDGVGVDPTLIERVFEPFVSTKPAGVGLGLVNVRAVVVGHGGGIRLEPRQPRGTCAHLWLPVPAHG